MHTVVTSSPAAAARTLRAGGLVAFPTETVYGLGADATNEAAVHAVFRAKGRPSDNPLIVHLADASQIVEVARGIEDLAWRLIRAFMPGPLTVVLPRRDDVPDVTTAGLDTVAVRVPGAPVTREFLRACALPVAAPSANRSGGPSPTTWQAVLADLGGHIDCILQGPQSAVGLESTVVDCTGDVPTILRTGALTLEALREVVPVTRLSPDDAELARRSPGTRHRHYAPRARVELVDHPDDVAHFSGRSAYLGVDAPQWPQSFAVARICRDVEDYAFALYDFFRACDDAGVERLFCQRVEPSGLGRALMDRLERASAQ